MLDDANWEANTAIPLMSDEAVVHIKSVACRRSLVSIRSLPAPQPVLMEGTRRVSFRIRSHQAR